MTSPVHPLRSLLREAFLRRLPVWLIIQGAVLTIWITSWVHSYGWSIFRLEANLLTGWVIREWLFPMTYAVWLRLCERFRYRRIRDWPR